MPEDQIDTVFYNVHGDNIFIICGEEEQIIKGLDALLKYKEKLEKHKNDKFR
jgi:hypothetical protein